MEGVEKSPFQSKVFALIKRKLLTFSIAMKKRRAVKKSQFKSMQRALLFPFQMCVEQWRKGANAQQIHRHMRPTPTVCQHMKGIKSANQIKQIKKN